MDYDGFDGIEDVREDETIAVDPAWVLWVEGHELVEQDVSYRSHAHGRSGMTGVGRKGGIDLRENSCQCFVLMEDCSSPSLATC